MRFDAALASVIDHSCLRPDAIGDEIDRLCDEALAFTFRTVCVQPVFVVRAARRLAGTGVGIAAVVAFPHGATTTDAKLYEARRALDDGATELDVVANLGWIRAGDTAALTAETAAIVGVTAVAMPGALVKVILETALFAEPQKLAAAHAVMKGQPAFLKTSTGFGPGGATLADVALLRRVAGDRAQVKASGGIRTRADALALRAAGADRLGTSASAGLVTLDSAQPG